MMTGFPVMRDGWLVTERGHLTKASPSRSINQVETAKLIVSRTSERDLKFRGIELLLDGEFIGNLNYGDTVHLDISPGPHTLKATNRLKSQTIEFEAISGETASFETTGIALAGIWIIISMMGTVAYRVELKRIG